jgi:DNA polymerase-3 subunit alpha
LLHADRAATLASVGLAFEWADTQEANALQGGLFDMGDTGGAGDSHGSSTQEPALVHVPPWDVRERLMQEKAALGFFLSGHLFDAWRDEVQRIARTPLAELAAAAAARRGPGEAQVMAGIVTDARSVNGQRGKVLIFKLDDGSEAIEAVVNDELIANQRELMVEDQLVIVQGKLQQDRFSGGVRLNVLQVWDLAAARARYGRYISVDINGSTPPVADVLRLWPARRVATDQGELRQGLAIRLRVRRSTVTADIELGDEARFWPCDEALGRWRSIAHGGFATIVYE